MAADDRLRAALRADAAEAPRPEEILTGIRMGVTRRRRQRRTAQVGIAVLALGGVAVGIPLAVRSRSAPPSQLRVAGEPPTPDATASTSTPSATSSGGPSPDPAASARKVTGEIAPVAADDSHSSDMIQAYFAHGYGYDDAVLLGDLWRTADDEAETKALAGQQLSDGRALPISPGQAATAGAVDQNVLDADLAAYSAAGFTASDAGTLATLWHETSLTEAEALLGQQLRDGKHPRLP